MLTALLTFIAAATLIVLLPGPDTLVVVRSIVRSGRREATLCVLGVLTGLTIWVVAAAFGLSALVRASHLGYEVLRVVGAGYLILLGLQSLRSRRLGVDPAIARGRSSILGTGYRAGLTTDLLNPKVGIFFISFLPGFVPHGDAIGPMIVLLGGIFVVETALYFALILAVADRLIAWMQSARTRRRLDRATGLVLIGFGLRLAAER